MAISSPCTRTSSELSTLIRTLDKGVKYSGPQKAEDIRAIESSLNLCLPSDFRQFIGNYGSLSANGVTIFGLGKPQAIGMPIGEAVRLLRQSVVAMPLGLVPIEHLGDRRFACLATSKKMRDHCPVVEIDLSDPLPLRELPQLALCFRDYLFDRLSQSRRPTAVDNTDRAFAVLEQHVRDHQNKFKYDHDKGGKLPRNHDWRPYRFCIQDVLFGATVVRHLREENCLQVDVFLTAEIPEYDPLAGTQALATFLLSEAYKCGGTMEIRFTKNVEDGKVPNGLKQLATRYGVAIGQNDKDRISPAEAKSFYAALTNFPAELQEKINALEQAGKVKMARACFAVHHGIWTREQVEMVVLGSQRPDSVLAGLTDPSQRHLYAHDLFHARAALMSGMLDLYLSKRDRVSAKGITYDMEDDLRPIQSKFDGDLYAKRFQSNEEITLPWLHLQTNQNRIPAGQPFWVLVRARDAADMLMNLEEDIQQALQVGDDAQNPTFILVPSDFTSLPPDFMKKIGTQLKKSKIRLMVCPETVRTLDADAAQHLARSRVLRK